MKFRSKVSGLAATLAWLVLPAAAGAGQGLVAPAADVLWPGWQARISVQTTALTPVSYSPWSAGEPAQRSLQGGAVLGDYYFATPSFGRFRASGGLMMGAIGGVPVLAAHAGPRLGLSVQALGSSALPVPGAEASLATVPYLGVGFSSALWRNALFVTADVGLVAAGSVGRALFGNQGMDAALHQLRLAPVAQLGVRYSF